MTDHLEPYRRMVRSMRFSPPLSLTQLSQKSVAHLLTTEPVDSWLKTTLADTYGQSVSEPPIDPSEHTAALIHEAVRKPTVLPTTYVILENIGDRISRLTTPKPVAPVTIPFKIPQADANTTAIQTSEAEPVQADSSESIDDTPVVTVAQPVEVEDTSADEAAVATEPVAEEEILDNNLVVTESVEVEETPSDASDNSLSTDVIGEASVLTETESEADTSAVEAEDTQAPTLLDRVSSVVEAVSNAFKKPDTEHQDSDAVGELAPTDSLTTETPATDTTEGLTTAAPTPADEAKETSAPTLVERVSSAVEAVVTTLKDIGVDQKNSEAVIEPKLAKDDNILESQVNEITCPKCHSTEIRKNGRRQDKQRYFCKDCGRQFVISSLEKEEDNPELDKSASVETSNLKGSQGNIGVDNNLSKSSKPSSKKKAKAKGFGNSKAK